MNSYCTNCGLPTTPKTRYCSGCGSPVEHSESTQPLPESSTNRQGDLRTSEAPSRSLRENAGSPVTNNARKALKVQLAISLLIAIVGGLYIFTMYVPGQVKYRREYRVRLENMLEDAIRFQKESEERDSKLRTDPESAWIADLPSNGFLDIKNTERALADHDREVKQRPDSDLILESRIGALFPLAIGIIAFNCICSGIRFLKTKK